MKPLLYKVNTNFFETPLNEITPTIEYFFDDVHFNENGSKAVAEVLHGCLSTILND